MTIAKIKLYKPHEAQKILHASNARFRVVNCGRRFGKTLMCVNELIKHTWEHPKHQGYWVAPVFRQCRLAYSLITRNIKPIIRSATLNPMQIELTNNSIIKFASTENYDTIRGDNSHFMIVDESSTVPEDAIYKVLRPMLSDTNGRAIYISTPAGRNWFYHAHLRGQDDTYTEYESFTFPTSANPYISASEIEEARLTLPHDVFRQEYLAEFLDDGGSVYRNIQACVRGSLEEPQTDGEYYLSWDIAKHTDFSCVIVIDKKRMHVVAFDRFNRIDYNVQIERVAKLAHNYKARIILDSTGVGDPILEAVKARGLIADGYNFTNTSKQQLIEHLAVLIEKQEITFPNIQPLINELMTYQYEVTRAGNIRYNAPQGMHDDCVIALALAAWSARHTVEPKVWWL